MKSLFTIATILLALFATGCDNDDPVVVDPDPVPATPQGVYSVTGDEAVYVYWNGIYDNDVDYYTVYRSLQPTTGYVEVANVNAAPNPTLDLLLYEYVDFNRVNGETYWYAVTAVDGAGQESELSAEDVFDTPRPEGYATILPSDVAPTAAGFYFEGDSVVQWDSPFADIFIDRTVDTLGNLDIPYLNAGWNAGGETDIQDMGYTNGFDDIGYAPTDGWSELGYVEAITGHTYVIWTFDDHYAKVRISSISAIGAISFEWAYQTDVSNLELAPPVRPERDREEPLPKRTVETQLLK